MPDEPHHETQVVTFASTDGEVQFTLNGDRDTLWGTRQQIAAAFGCTEHNVRHHIRKIYEENELEETSTCKQDLQVQSEGGRSVKRTVDFYNLDVMLSVGYRVSSQKATQFRQWANKTLRQFITRGYALNEEMLANDPSAQRELYTKLRALRHEEKAMYQKVKDVFKVSASDYDPHSQEAKSFFAKAQDKFHYAITQKTAAEIILTRADANKQKMGMRTLKGDEPTQAEAEVAKNYFTEHELQGLENICEQFLLFAEAKAFRGKKMTMEELATKLNTLLAVNDYPVLYEYKSYLRAQANAHVHSELKAYKARIAAPKETKSLPAPKKPIKR
jgi:hypothetical protein